MWNMMMAGYILRLPVEICNAASPEKKSQKGAKALDTAQNHVEILCKKLITPIKTRFSNLIHSFRSIL